MNVKRILFRLIKDNTILIHIVIGIVAGYFLPF